MFFLQTLFLLYQGLIFNNILETIYNVGNSIKGPITSTMAINSLCGNDVIATASASGLLRARVVMVKLA